MEPGATEVRDRPRRQGRQQRGLRGRREGAGPGEQRQECSSHNRLQKLWLLHFRSDLRFTERHYDRMIGVWKEGALMPK